MRNNKNRTFDYGTNQPALNGKLLINNNDQQKIKDIICFSHLRWDFVFQRPQHLLTRWAKESRVFYFEEPVIGNYESNFLKTIYSKNLKLTVITPHIKENTNENDINLYLKDSVHEIIKWYNVSDYLLWYLTPMAVEFTGDLRPKTIVYDSMDELSAFKGAHPNMLKNENTLFKMADVVFTGGYHLYEFKKNRHHNIHPIPSSIDQAHFESGLGGKDPDDQVNIPFPRVGFFGVLDERLNIELLDGLALKMPDYHFIMIGPVVKIDPASLPRHENIHYLGQKSYQELPLYLAHWDVAFLPFAKNDSTRFISPTKIPEYLSANKPVVSTSIRDVIVPYGEMGMVEIADAVDEFSSAIKRMMTQRENANWQKMVKEHLKTNSWDLTWSKMKNIIYTTLESMENVPGVPTAKKEINHFSYNLNNSH
ncbi:MAG: glycosyltransferase family 1 protein [Candidatus Saccharibacteria bacterium]